MLRRTKSGRGASISSTRNSSRLRGRRWVAVKAPHTDTAQHSTLQRWKRQRRTRRGGFDVRSGSGSSGLIPCGTRNLVRNLDGRSGGGCGERARLAQSLEGPGGVATSEHGCFSRCARDVREGEVVVEHERTSPRGSCTKQRLIVVNRLRCRRSRDESKANGRGNWFSRREGCGLWRGPGSLNAGKERVEKEAGR